MSKGPKAGSLKVRPGSGEWTSLTAGAQDLRWEPGRKVGAVVGQNGEGLGKHSTAFELTLHFTEQARGAWGILGPKGSSLLLALPSGVNPQTSQLLRDGLLLPLIAAYSVFTFHALGLETSKSK